MWYVTLPSLLWVISRYVTGVGETWWSGKHLQLDRLHQNHATRYLQFAISLIVIFEPNSRLLACIALPCLRYIQTKWWAIRDSSFYSSVGVFSFCKFEISLKLVRSLDSLQWMWTIIRCEFILCKAQMPKMQILQHKTDTGRTCLKSSRIDEAMRWMPPW